MCCFIISRITYINVKRLYIFVRFLPVGINHGCLFYLEREQQTFRTKPKKKRTKTQIIGTTQVTIGQASDLWETVPDELSAGAVKFRSLRKNICQGHKIGKVHQ